MEIHSQALGKYYDRTMFDAVVEEWYDHSDFHNMGYWLKDTQRQREACENLMEQLLAFIPEKKGRILDVACGNGATTKYLLKYYPPFAVTGVNIGIRQLKRCKTTIPSCSFLAMDATELAVQSDSCDAIVCVEAAMHFKTRRRFLEEARRVLKPGGHLVLSDMLQTQAEESQSRFLIRENLVRSLEEYRSLWESEFYNVVIVDATEECLRRYCERRAKFLQEGLSSGKIGWFGYQHGIIATYRIAQSTLYYVLASGRKG